jgi:hypothetical protein
MFREEEDLQNKWYELRKKREKESGKRQRND